MKPVTQYMIHVIRHIGRVIGYMHTVARDILDVTKDMIDVTVDAGYVSKNMIHVI
jgi:hypothetical protein